jgi:glycine hydroxymethyltransferase
MSTSAFFRNTLAQQDQAVMAGITGELQRQRDQIEMIA